jgi:CRP/FNR family transcriptional regulator, cyclic AMP receptor protein
MHTMSDLISEHPFFHDLSQDQVEFIASCGKNVIFKEGEQIARHGDHADTFYLIREGHVSLSLEIPPAKPFTYLTLSKGDILGLSWLIPPYRWTAAANAIETTHAIALDGACLRNKCEEDTRLGYKLMKQLVKILVKREEAARLHLLDVYS